MGPRPVRPPGYRAVDGRATDPGESRGFEPSGVTARGLAGEYRPEPLLERRTGKRADDPVYLAPVAKYD